MVTLNVKDDEKVKKKEISHSGEPRQPVHIVCFRIKKQSLSFKFWFSEFQRKETLVNYSVRLNE